MSMEEDLGKVVAEHEVKYDDGDVEWLYLGQERFEIVKEESSKQPAKKKQKRKIVDSDSEDEFIPSDEEPEEEEYVPDEPIVTPSPKKKKKTTPSSLSSFASSSSGTKRSRTKITPSTTSSRKRSKFSTPATTSSVTSTASTPGSGVLAMGQHAHDVDSAFSFLRPDKIRDKNRRRPDDPDYDATTLFVPPTFLKKQTPAKQQWWEIKSDNMDAVLFFKVGKFYEIFHMDADVAVRTELLVLEKRSYEHTHTHTHRYVRRPQPS